MRDNGGSEGRDGHVAPIRQENTTPRQMPSRERNASRDRHGSPRAQTDSHHRHDSRDRSKDQSGDHRPESKPRPAPIDDLIPRFRDKQAKEPEAETPSHRSRSHGRGRQDSPSSSRRHRSRSASRDSVQRKRQRRENSSSRRDRSRDRDRHIESSRKRRRHSSHDRHTSPRRHGRSQKSSSKSSQRQSKSRRHSYTRSPGPQDRGSYGGRSDGRRRSRSRSRSRSRQQHSRDSAQHNNQDPFVQQISEDLKDRRNRELSIDTHHSSRSGREDNRRDFARHSRSPLHHHSPSSAGAGLSTSNTQANSPQHFSDHSTRQPPTGPASYAPSGPSAHFGPGHNRGNQRTGFRGAPSSNRGTPRGPGFHNMHGGRPEEDDRRHHGENGTERRNSRPEPMDVDGDNRRNWNSAYESNLENRGLLHKADPPKNAPSGPAAQNASKFSFAFKPTSKPALAAPKPEISQKLTAAPRKPGIFQNQTTDGGPPPGAPTQPNLRGPDIRKAPDGPRMAPRMRKVKKIIKKLKPCPTLPDDHAASDSVFYRKPGNESVVGSGTYGKVFKGLNVYTKGSVALKKIRMEGEKDGFPVTAIREIKLLQSLRHANIVNLQEVMVEKNDCFMVFEYSAHDLTGILHHPSFTLEAPQKKDLARQLFEGLDYLHTRGVLHRDIKAANILVGKDGILKIADFGLARFYAKRHQLEYTNRVITIWYRCPELLLGETKYTASVDVWSAACVMMEIFMRQATFAGDGTELSQLEKIYSIMGTPNRHDWPGLTDMAWFELLRPTHKRPSVFAEKFQDKLTPAAYELLHSMFQYDPAKRPSAAEVLQHAYFTSEEPQAQQATVLATIDGDWHEFESKALRKEKERREREARKVAAATAAAAAKTAAASLSEKA